MDELESSELGTQEYWNNRYEEEIKNFKNHGDPGEIWFGEDSVDRIIRWLNNNESVSKDSEIIDIGCGNGMFLVELAREGYTKLYGVDYSQTAITLAENIAKEQTLDITYRACDISNGLSGNYDVIHDKGTYDAVSLSSNATESRQKYIENVASSLSQNGFFVITSCNWTHNELNEHFQDYFDCFVVIPTPQFKFGGIVGNVVSSVVYKKKANKNESTP